MSKAFLFQAIQFSQIVLIPTNQLGIIFVLQTIKCQNSPVKCHNSSISNNSV